jgi:hypothetical protein
MSEREWVVWHTMKNEYGQCSCALLEQDSACPFITVRTHKGTKSTQLGGHSPDLLARILMKEINAGACPGGCD